MKHYDIAIAGGAMVGATLALALDKLSRGKLSIAVIEPFPVDHHSHPGFDARAIALSYGTQQILKSFQLWDDLQPMATPIHRIHVSDKGHVGRTDIQQAEYGVDALGYVVELASVGRLYHQALQASRHIDLLCPDAVSGIERTDSQVTLQLDSGSALTCQLLVAADGADSICCKLLNIHTQGYDFQQSAVIANIEMAVPHNGRAFERFTESGPLALLPMSDNRMSLVWCHAKGDVQRVMALDEHNFRRELQQAFGWSLGEIKRIGARTCYPLILKQKEKLISHRFVALGNAAQLLHPIAGQGFNLGIRDVASLVDCLIGEHDVGDYPLLSRYRQSRLIDRHSTINLTAGLVHVFSNEWLPLQLARNIALLVMDKATPLKAPLIRKTMGLVDK